MWYFQLSSHCLKGVQTRSLVFIILPRIDRYDAGPVRFPKLLATFTSSQHLITTLPVHNMNITEQNVFDSCSFVVRAHDRYLIGHGFDSC